MTPSQIQSAYHRQTAGDLIAVADYLIVHGWQQHDTGIHGGPRCVGGATVSVVGQTTVAEQQRFWRLGDAIMRHANENRRYVNIPAWNDAPGRTLADVLRVLYTAAGAELRAAGTPSNLGRQTAPFPQRKDRPMVGTLVVADHTLDNELTWDTEDAASVEKVRAVFDQMVGAEKALAYTVPGDGNDQIIRSFDPEAAPKVVITPQLVGG